MPFEENGNWFDDLISVISAVNNNKNKANLAEKRIELFAVGCSYFNKIWNNRKLLKILPQINEKSAFLKNCSWNSPI